jgi:hypothetical protein
MKLLLKFLLQLPLLSFLYVGIHAVVGVNFWIATLVGLGVLILYTTGDYLDLKNETD